MQCGVPVFQNIRLILSHLKVGFITGKTPGPWNVWMDCSQGLLWTLVTAKNYLITWEMETFFFGCPVLFLLGRKVSGWPQWRWCDLTSSLLVYFLPLLLKDLVKNLLTYDSVFAHVWRCICTWIHQAVIRIILGKWTLKSFNYVKQLNFKYPFFFF